MKKSRFLAVLLCLALLVVSFAGCSAQAPNEDYGGMDSGKGEYSDSLNGSGSDQSGSSDVLTGRKLIRKISMEAETEDMDALLSDVNSRVAALGGYIESRNVQNGSIYSNYRNRHATLVIRIPAEHLDDFVDQVSKQSNIVSTMESSDDVTLQYVATESRLKVLRTEENRLLQFLAEAKTVSEMLEIEKRLTQVQSEIESTTSQLKTYDNLVDYGTITLKVTEVEVFTVVEKEEPTMWEQISKGFMESVTDLLAVGRAIVVFLLARSPYLVLIGLVAAVVVMIMRRNSRKYRQNRRPPQPPPASKEQ